MEQVKPAIYNREYFLKSCDGYDYWKDSFGKKLNPRLAYSLEIAKLKKGEKVLDFGCGRGEMVVQSAIIGCETVGIDYSPESISLTKEAITKNKLKNCRAILTKGNKLPFREKSFDVVFFLDVAEHLNDKELINSFKEIRRVLKMSGRLIIHTSPNKEWVDKGYRYYTRWINFVASKLIWEPFFKIRLLYQKDPRSSWEKKVHINEQTVESLKNALQEADFRDINIWLDSKFRITSKGFWFQYTFLQPIWIPVLGKYFTSDIWAVVQR